MHVTCHSAVQGHVAQGRSLSECLLDQRPPILHPTLGVELLSGGGEGPIATEINQQQPTTTIWVKTFRESNLFGAGSPVFDMIGTSASSSMLYSSLG